MPAALSPRDVDIETVNLDPAGVIVERRRLSVRGCAETVGQDIALDLVRVPAGEFMMGSIPGQGFEDEGPRRRVRVSAFWMSRGPITQAQWGIVMGKPKGRFDGPNRPVETVAWTAAGLFCERLAARTGRAYQMPSEAQWEYACRAGTSGPFAFGETLTTGVANYNGGFSYRSGPRGEYRHTTTDAGSFPPNAFGLFDLHGNVWEWCADPWHDSYVGAPDDDRVWMHGGQLPFRVARGGSWHDTPDVCRSAARLKVLESEGDELTGFRVVIRLPAAPAL